MSAIMEPTLIGGSNGFKTYPVEDALQRMAAVGYTGVEMWKPHLNDFKTPEALSHLRKFVTLLGLKLYGLNAVGEEFFDPFSNSESFERTLRRLEHSIDLAVDLGVNMIMVWEGIRPETDDLSNEQLLAKVVQLFQTAIAYSKPRGVRILVEPHPFTLAMNLDFAIMMCDKLDPEYFGLMYDFCHFGVAKPDDYVKPVHVLDHRIHHVHLSDSDLRTSEYHYPPGLGCMDLEAVVSTLSQIGYQGTIALDLWAYPLPEEGSKIGLPVLKEVIEKLGLF